MEDKEAPRNFVNMYFLLNVVILRILL